MDSSIDEEKVIAYTPEPDEKNSGSNNNTNNINFCNGGESMMSDISKVEAKEITQQLDYNERSFKFRSFVEIAVLVVVIIGVWGLISLPIVFYHLPEPGEVNLSS